MTETDLTDVLACVAQVTGIPEEHIKSQSRLKELVTARHLYCYLASIRTESKQEEIAALINRERSTISSSGNKIAGQMMIAVKNGGVGAPSYALRIKRYVEKADRLLDAWGSQ